MLGNALNDKMLSRVALQQSTSFNNDTELNRIIIELEQNQQSVELNVPNVANLFHTNKASYLILD